MATLGLTKYVLCMYKFGWLAARLKGSIQSKKNKKLDVLAPGKYTYGGENKKANVYFCSTDDLF